MVAFGLVLPLQLAAQDALVVEAARKEVVLKGYTRSETTLTLSSEVAGKVLKVNYDVGDTIGDGPFCEIDPTFIKFQIESARHSIRELEIALERNRSRTAYLNKEFNRIDRLWRGNSTAETQRDRAQEDLVQSELEGASLNVRLAEMQTMLAELKERRRRHTINAPKGWVLVKRMIEPGEIIAMNTPLAGVADYRRMMVPLYVSGRELNAIKALPATFDALLEGRPVQASIHWINPEFDEKTRKLAIEIMLNNTPLEHRGGLLLSLPLEIGSEGLRVPKQAVSRRYENPRVKLQGSGEIVQVLILGESDGHFIIADHPRLAPGTRLAAEP
jgi:multidrug efflux pump subunit AcrA (membrane-fusion protein)